MGGANLSSTYKITQQTYQNDGKWCFNYSISNRNAPLGEKDPNYWIPGKEPICSGTN